MCAQGSWNSQRKKNEKQKDPQEGDTTIELTIRYFSPLHSFSFSNEPWVLSKSRKNKSLPV